MATQSQVKFFDQCLDEREFPDGVKTDKLRSDFAPLSTAAASKWIENALQLPKKDAEAGDNTPPPF